MYIQTVTYSCIKKESSTNLQRKFIKQYLQEKEPNNSVKNAKLNSCRNHSTSRNTSTKVTKAKNTENN